ncbi:MAG: aspartate-semialdehyde dehydrogenase [Alphaproteobacteria bacterium]
MGCKIAVVGASGNVGREMINILEERNFPADEIVPIASSRSAGKTIPFKDGELIIQDLEKYDFKGTDIVLSSPGSSVSKVFAPKAAAAGAIVVDNTSFFRTDPDVPLIVPEVNPEAIAGYTKKNIIANPNCSTIQMVVALKPLADLAKIKRVVVSTYQSVSGAGKEAMDELFDQTRGIYANEPARPEKFTKQIAFNAIPHIDVFMEDGRTKEEWKMDFETKKIMGSHIAVCANCVRIPAFVGHGEMVNVEFESPITEDAAREALKNAEGISLVDYRENGGYVTVEECAGQDPVYVSRLRMDPTAPNSLNMWVVADNLRKGAALNTVQIAEVLVRDYLNK